MNIDTKGREFEIASEVADLLDTLTKQQQNQVMAMLASRYGLKITEPSPVTRGSGYRPKPKRKN